MDIDFLDGSFTRLLTPFRRTETGHPMQPSIGSLNLILSKTGRSARIKSGQEPERTSSPHANNRDVKRKIEYPVLRYGWIDHRGLDNYRCKEKQKIPNFGVYQENGAT
jgi:hypothetical protein